MDEGIAVVGQKLLIPLELIRPFEGQPRTNFNKKKIKELAASIKAVGQRVPIEVRELKEDPQYQFELIGGECRLKACQLEGAGTILAIVTEVEDTKEQFEMSFVENFCRNGLGHMETARAIDRMVKNGTTVQRVADIAGREVVWAYQHLSLLKLTPKVQAMLDFPSSKKTRLSFTIAHYISAHVPDSKLQQDLAEEILKRGMRTVKAKHFINTRLKELGIDKKNIQRKPHKDYSMLIRFLDRFEGEISLLAHSPEERFQRMLQERDPRVIGHVVTSLQKCKAGLDQLCEKIKKVKNDT